MLSKFVLGGLIALALLAPQVTAPAHGQGIYQGGSYEPGLVPWRGRTALGPYGIQPQPRYYNGYRGYGYGNGYRSGSAYYRSQGSYARSRGMRVQSYTIQLSRTCHDWKMEGGVKVYTRHYAC